jgi:pimeloyl-ACP methyl ester carboxylesterase
VIPLVLVPGLLCDAELWRPQVDGLSDIAKPWIADATRHDDMEALAAALLAEAPAERFALAGLSMGGYVALAMVRQAPERITHLALLDTSARADTPERRQARMDLMSLAERGRFLGVTNALLPNLVHPDRLADAELVAIIKRMAANVGQAAFLRQERAIMSRLDSRGYLQDIRCPTLVLCGRQDGLTPLEGHVEIANGIAGATLAVIERCGHLSTLERPAEVNTALRSWLAEPARNLQGGNRSK